MMNQQSSVSLNRNSSSRKTQFAVRFLRALTRIKMATPVESSSSVQSRKKCSRRIKRAADTSMAATIGSRRSWSRAILLKHRNQVRNRVLIRQRVIDSKGNNKIGKIKTRMNKEKKIKPSKIDDFNGVEGSENRADKLRKLVPGGDAMDFCSLLEETAHYIKCLNTQVQLMQKIADIYET
ncbi:hypothetical protein MKX01_037957 [Papaver californicum]|nr:hypothetical protein MKX01_037957 [Papaver californicum]